MDHRKKFMGEDRWLRDLGDIQRVTDHPLVGKDTRIDGSLVRFDQKMLLDLLRRREAGTENDSLRSRRYDGGGGGGNSSDTQTEAAALRGLPEDAESAELAGHEVRPDDWRYSDQPDPVGMLIEEALAEFDVMARAARKFEVKLMRILNAGDGRRGRQSSLGQCQACGRDVPGTTIDRLRSGYCDRVAGPPVGPPWSGCYRKWVDQGRPDRPRFEVWVKAQVTELADSSDDGPGYRVAEIHTLQASGVLPQGSAA